MIEKPKKERRFLKALGRVGEILIEQVLIKVGSSLIKRIGGKKTLPSILFLLFSFSLFAQFPTNINKQRLGFQTTADGLVWRGSLSDTASIQPVSNQNAWVILDTVNLKIYSFDFTSNVWNQLPSGTTVDTTSLSNRINLKLNIADTASMLLPYFRDTDTSLLNLTSRFAAKLNISDTATMLTPYFKKSDTTSLNLVSRFNAKLNLSDTLNMLTPYLRKADTTAMLLPYFRDADTTSLNLVSRFAAKQNILNGTGFVKASGTTISYDNSTYLTTSSAASTYLPLTGGTLSKTTVYQSSDTILTKFFIKSGANNFIPTYAIFAEAEHHVSQGAIGIYGKGSSLRGTTIGIQGLGVQTDMNGFGTAIGVRGDVNATFANSGGTNGTTYAGYFSNNATVDGNNYGLFVNTSNKGDYGIYQTGTGINYFGSNSTFAGTLGVTGASTLTGALTVNNATVLNEGSGDFDTRIESDGNANMVFVDASTDRVGIGTNTPSKTLDVNGEVKIATVTATPTSLLGKDGSNVVGEVTDINQSGVMKVGSITENTSSVGIINVPHGLSYTPTKVIATIAQQSSYVIVCHGITSTNLNFTIYDSTDGTALNNVSVGFFWIAFK